MKTKTCTFAVVLLLLLTACGSDDPASSPTPAALDGAEEPTTDEPTSEPEEPTGENVIVQAWFIEDERVAPTNHEIPATTAVGRAALEVLFTNEDGEETAVPQGTELLGLTIESGIATVDLSGEFDDGGGSFSTQARLAQVVFTLTQFPTVSRVEFMIDGEAVETFSGEGIVLDHPQSRNDFEDFAPLITVAEPRAGATVSSPVSISGDANVFEATVSIRILDAAGEVIAEDFTTATCGTGCRGDYSTKVKFQVDEAQDGTIEVFESSAEDGSQQHVVQIPVTLTP